MPESNISSEGIRTTLLRIQKRLLEGFTAGFGTAVVLEDLCLDVEESFGDDKRCTAFVVRDQKLWLIAAPSMPDGFAAASMGIDIGPRMGSCGTAAYRSELVVTADVSIDPNWEDHQVYADTFEIGSSWSVPVFGAKDEGILGTFALYGRTAETPTDGQIELLERVADLVGLLLSRDKSEEERRRERERFEHLVQETQLGIWEWDPVEDIVWFSDTAQELVGWGGPSVMPREALESLVNDVDLEHVTSLVDMHLRGETDMFEFEVRYNRNGEWRWILDRGRVVERAPDGTPTMLLGSLQDITELKRTEQELQRMQRLEGLGRVAGGVAHDFNNILVGIFGGIALAKETLDASEPAYQDLELAEDSLERARGLTGQLLTFSRGGDPLMTDVDLAEVVEGIVRFDLSGSKIAPFLDISADLWNAQVDPGQIQQVFSNLVINTREATEGSGSIHVSLENAYVTDDEQLVPGHYIRALLRDDGPGIERDSLERVFEPYFSTKPGGRGLGLATVHSIICRHGGKIGVTSKPGEGTTFEMFLPATTRLVASFASDVEDDATSPPLNVLVMDDQTDVLTVSSRMLRKLGHDVALARSGDEAVKILEEATEAFDLLLVDLTVPGERGGAEVVSQLRAINPNVRIVASSGYTEDDVMSKFASFGFDGVLAKPFTLTELNRAISRAMKV